MDGKVVIGTELDTKGFEKGLKQLENEEVGLDVNTSDLEKTKEEIKKGITEALQEAEAYVEALQEMFPDIDIADMLSDGNNEMDKLVKKADDFGKGMANTIKKIGRMALAVFGIRSAFSMIRNAMNIISQYDSQLKADIDYMKNAMAFALEPIVRKVVELAQKLMFYVAYIIKAWTGRDIFANANKSLKQANGEAKKLSKTLAGFDEMNVLNDSSSGGGGGVATPSFDLTAPEDIQPPSWLVWIGNNGKTIATLIAGITGALIALKFGINGIIGLGIGIAIAGIILLIKDVIKFIKDPSWSNFINVLNSLSIALIGVGIAMVAFNASNPIGWIMLAIGAIGLLVTAVVKNWGKIKETLSKAWQWIKDKFNGLPGWAKELLKGIGNAVVYVINHIIDKLNAFLLPLRAVIATIGKVTGKNWTIGSVAIPRVPYLAKGGIVNYPGKGVPVGSAITGESGREGVIPLTDSQQMALLGEAIGKYININATIPVYVANRQIAKEIRRINAEDDFAFNR